MNGTGEITLVSHDGELSQEPLREPNTTVRPGAKPESRVAYAAAHVVPRVLAENTPGSQADIDWEATLEIRRHIYESGLGVADAMDTAQRNLGLDFAGTRELIRRSADLARECSGSLVVGVNTDHLQERRVSLREAIDAYKLQLEVAEDAGAEPVLMASRHLASAAPDAKTYIRAYSEVLKSASKPLILHWLGEAFDPSLAGYFGSANWRVATGTVTRIIENNSDRVSGIKMSLLDSEAEVAVRQQLPDGVRMFTGDDFNYVRLIGGAEAYGTDPAGGGFDDSRGFSDALLGAFAAFPRTAAAALRALDRGDIESYKSMLEPTEALSRQIFSSPTYYYKTGIAFISWLNGMQPAFQMVGGLHSARSLPHLSRIVELANAARVFEQPELALERWHAVLRLNGVDS